MNTTIRKVNKRGLILCEGQTEEKYFKGLISHPENKRKLGGVSVDIYKPKNHSPAGLVTEAKEKIKAAKKENNAYDFVWVVFDKDGHVDLPKAFNEIYTTKGTPKINHAFSITCFEYFILLHYVNTTKQYSKCDAIVSDLKAHFPDYEKATNTYNYLFDKKKIANSNCKFVLAQVENDIIRGTPIYNLPYYCNVHELVEYLENLQ